MCEPRGSGVASRAGSDEDTVRGAVTGVARGGKPIVTLRGVKECGAEEADALRVAFAADAVRLGPPPNELPEEERDANEDLAADEDGAELFELLTCEAVEEAETLPPPPKCALLPALAWPPPPPLRCAKAGCAAKNILALASTKTNRRAVEKFIWLPSHRPGDDVGGGCVDA